MSISRITMNSGVASFTPSYTTKSRSASSAQPGATARCRRASGRGGRIFCFVVDGDPTSRDPNQTCFPPALLAPEVEGGPPREPAHSRAGNGFIGT